MFTIAGFGEDLDLAGAFANLAALADDHLFTSGDNLRVPELNRLIGAFGGIGTGSTGVMRLESPSLRDVNRLRLSPLNGGADADPEPDDPPAVVDMRNGPRLLTVDEQVQVLADSNTSAAAFQWLLLLLADGAVSPVTGEIITVRATGTTTVTARAWSTVTLSFDDVLPSGRYQVVGMRAEAATALAARLIFKPGTWRPGCIGQDTVTGKDHPMFRYGALGIWGEFNQTTPPDAEFLCGSADSAETVFLDLIRV